MSAVRTLEVDSLIDDDDLEDNSEQHRESLPDAEPEELVDEVNIGIDDLLYFNLHITTEIPEDDDIFSLLCRRYSNELDRAVKAAIKEVLGEDWSMILDVREGSIQVEFAGSPGPAYGNEGKTFSMRRLGDRIRTFVVRLAEWVKPAAARIAPVVSGVYTVVKLTASLLGIVQAGGSIADDLYPFPGGTHFSSWLHKLFGMRRQWGLT